MIKVPRSQSTSIKTLIYPEKRKFEKNHQMENIKDLRKMQAENKLRKVEKENMVLCKNLNFIEFHFLTLYIKI